jgi:hypothetical protein
MCQLAKFCFQRPLHYLSPHKLEHEPQKRRLPSVRVRLSQVAGVLSSTMKIHRQVSQIRVNHPRIYALHVINHAKLEESGNLVPLHGQKCSSCHKNFGPIAASRHEQQNEESKDAARVKLDKLSQPSAGAALKTHCCVNSASSTCGHPGHFHLLSNYKYAPRSSLYSATPMLQRRLHRGPRLP